MSLKRICVECRKEFICDESHQKQKFCSMNCYYKRGIRKKKYIDDEFEESATEKSESYIFDLILLVVTVVLITVGMLYISF